MRFKIERFCLVFQIKKKEKISKIEEDNLLTERDQFVLLEIGQFSF